MVRILSMVILYRILIIYEAMKPREEGGVVDGRLSVFGEHFYSNYEKMKRAEID